MTKHRRAQVIVTVGIFLATVVHFLCSAFAPHLQDVAPLAGLGASLIWIWIE